MSQAFKCDVCGKFFAGYSYRVLELKTHTGKFITAKVEGEVCQECIKKIEDTLKYEFTRQ